MLMISRQVLDLESNHLVKIDGLENNTKLRELNCSKNKLSNLHDGCLGALMNIEKLALAYNKLEVC